jgi:hypothetical protein
LTARKPSGGEQAETSQSMSVDKRVYPRRRTRLRSGKVTDRHGRFLTECLIYDRSPNGARLRFTTDVSVVPDRVLLFDDELRSLTSATVAWRRANELGVRFMLLYDADLARRVTRKLSSKYYAL